MLRNLIQKNRSCRRFHQTHLIHKETLEGLVDLARLSASAANLQPLRYILSCEAEKNEAIFECLGWAGYLPDWPGPAPGERPGAYIIMLGDARITKNIDWDCGIAGQSITLGAREQGLAGCMIASINRKKLRSVLGTSEHYSIALVIAIGKPKESAIIEPVTTDIKYWRDDNSGHHVPKRNLYDIILNTYE